MHVGSPLENNKINNKKSLQYAAFFDSALQVFLTSAISATNIIYGKGAISHRTFLTLYFTLSLLLAAALLRASNSRLKSAFNVDLARRNLEIAKNRRLSKVCKQNQLACYSVLNKPFLSEFVSRLFYVLLSASAPYLYKNGHIGTRLYCVLLALIALLTTVSYYNALREREKCDINCKKLLDLIQNQKQDNDSKQKSFSKYAKPLFRSFVFCILRMASMGIAFMYSKGELNDGQFAISSLITSSLLAFLLLCSIKSRQTNVKNLDDIVTKLEEKKSKYTSSKNGIDSLSEKLCRCFPLIVACELVWVVAATLNPYLYKKGCISELVYYSIMACMTVFSLLNSYPSTFQRIETQAKSYHLLDLTYDQQVLKNIQSDVSL